jgi:predicted nucleotidyltransferase
MPLNNPAISHPHWTADTLLAFLRSHANELRAMGVIQIGLFGSYVRGEQVSDSDIDFLFRMENFSWRRWMTVWNFLENHLGVEIDLIPQDDLRPELHPYVLPEVRYAEGF